MTTQEIILIVVGAFILLILVWLLWPKKKSKPSNEKTKTSSTQKETNQTTKEVATSEATSVASKKVPRYHVSQNKDDKSPNYKMWRVRKEGSDKTIKYFKSQKEAIDHADQLARSAGTTFVIHKVDGTIRKQDYSKD